MTSGAGHPELDEDAVIACADLVSRTGATAFKIGYLDDDRPGTWYAYAQYRGARISADDRAGPVEAADALARRLLRRATCQHCRREVALADAGVRYCRWRRMGAAWVRGCEADHVG